jgi:hypothetical protein
MRAICFTLSSTALLLMLVVTTLAQDSAGSFLSTPEYFLREENPNNPIASAGGSGYPNGNPNEVGEQYAGSGFKLPNGEIWMYVKGTGPIYAWKSTDDGLTWALQNGGNPVLSPNKGGVQGWDNQITQDPLAVYDEDTDTIYLYYKGYNGSIHQVGVATASGSNPTVFTKYANNPILTPSQVQSAIGVTGANVNQVNITGVVKNGSTYYFFGNAYQGTAPTDQTHSFYATGTSLLEPVTQGILPGFSGNSKNYYAPFVYKAQGSNVWTMLVTEGSYLQSGETYDYRRMVSALSSDLVHWTIPISGGIVSEPRGTGWIKAQAFVGRLLIKLNGEPVDLNGRWLYFLSGHDGVFSSQGVEFWTPSLAQAPRPVFRVDNSRNPPIWFSNPKGILTDGAISANASSSGIDLMFGTNLFLNENNTEQRFNLLWGPYAALALRRTGSVEIWAGENFSPSRKMLIDKAGVRIEGAGGFDTGSNRITLWNTDGGFSFVQHLANTGTINFGVSTGSNGNIRWSADLVTGAFNFYNSEAAFNINGTGPVNINGSLNLGGNAALKMGGTTRLNENGQGLLSGIALGTTTIGTVNGIPNSAYVFNALGNGEFKRNGTVGFSLTDTSQPVDKKVLQFINTGASFVIRRVNDANTTSIPYLSIRDDGSWDTSTGAKLTPGGSWTNSSSRELKTGFQFANGPDILDKIERLPLLYYNYKAEPGRTFLGPVAEDFNSIFGLGDSSTIAPSDLGGVSLAAIQELIKENRELRERLLILERKANSNDQNSNRDALPDFTFSRPCGLSATGFTFCK